MGIILEAVIESEAPGIGSCRLFVDVVRTHARSYRSLASSAPQRESPPYLVRYRRFVTASVG